jgi:hypothetical protein
MKAIRVNVYSVTPSGLSIFVSYFHNHFIPSGLNTVDEQIQKTKWS